MPPRQTETLPWRHGQSCGLSNGTISCGYLPGIQQTISRAETTAVLSALGWVQQREGVLHIWVDSQSVLDCFRDLLRGTGEVSNYEHSDLWRKIETLLKVTRAEIIPHKVVSHLPLEECTGPLEEWTRQWNAAADTQADLANMIRPQFFTRVWSRFQKYRKDWKRRIELLTSFHAAVAAYDCTGETTESYEDDQGFEVSHFDFVTVQNTAEVSVYLSTWQETGCFQCRLGSVADGILAQLCHWLISVDGSASEMRQVSLLEIFIAFRVFRGGSPLCVEAGEVDRYSVITFARDFSYFKRLFQCFEDCTHISWTFGQTDLTQVKVYPFQRAIWIGWPKDLEQSTLRTLQEFVGNRPITNCQGFSRPWRI